MKYICLLRGINVGGNNKVPMSELKACFEKLGFQDVSTYINSGNAFFETVPTDEAELVERCEVAVEEQFGFAVKLAVISADELHDSMKHAPKWWGDNPSQRHNALFVIAPATAEQVMDEIGDIKPEHEKIGYHGQIIFWTVAVDTISRTRWSRIVGTKAYKAVTIRNANTARKLVSLTKAA
jgi:uncharacterized protein (DUF1697 family)